MNGLLSEISTKRKALSEDISSRPTKYIRKGDLDRIQRQEEEAERQRKLAEKEERRRQEDAERVAREAALLLKKEKSGKKGKTKQGDAPRGDDTAESDETAKASFNPPPDEITRRLRLKSQPIRLFGEDDKDRRIRLRALELMEERGHHAPAGQNDFKKALDDVESVEKELMGNVSKPNAAAEKEREPELVDLDWIRSDKNKLHPAIYWAIKKRLKDWKEAMDARPMDVKQTTQGKFAAAMQAQSADSLKPLLKQLRTRTLADDMLPTLAEIVHYMQTRQYQKANDAYLRLSIGNAAWPIGVTMVGIHERSAREKISSDQVAHVFNDEVSRKYIQSIKRLLTFSQTKYPPDDRSQLMG
ncbi:Prp18 domain-containing protein [Flagelloscypha sp. PMI_526]|nr:Prp18 domain-containing protein [Flagelloscypha sp. PMI_526]